MRTLYQIKRWITMQRAHLIYPTLLRLILFFLPTFVFAFQPLPRFEGSEHVMFGNEIELYFPDSPSRQTRHIFKLPSGSYATYGDIIALGDLYGIEDEPISLGKTPADRGSRFIRAFN